MKHPLPRSLTAAGAVLILVTAPIVTAPSAHASPIVDESQWVQGNLGFNTYFTCIYTCQSYMMVSAKVNRWGPIGNESATPRVGERFYLHSYTAIISPFTLNDSYKMRLLLPTGLTPDVRSDTDVQCAITDLSFNVSRQIGPAECQDPVKVGVQWEFPNVSLSQGEAVSFFVPVVADRTFDGSQKIQLTSDAVNNPYTLLPDPVLSEVNVVVNPAPPAPPGTIAASRDRHRQPRHWAGQDQREGDGRGEEVEDEGDRLPGLGHEQAMDRPGQQEEGQLLEVTEPQSHNQAGQGHHRSQPRCVPGHSRRRTWLRRLDQR